MKKFLVAFLSVMLVSAFFSFPVSGAGASFKVDVSGATAASAGDTVKYVVEVKDINMPSSDPNSYASGLASLTLYVYYDTAFFEASSVNVTMPNITNGTWEMFAKKPADGKIKIEVASEEDSQTGKNPTVTANGVLKFEISIKVKSDAVEGSGKEIYIGSDTEGGDANLDITSNVTCGSLDVTLIKKLDKPAGVEFSSDYKAKWDAVANASSYELQLYKDGEKLGKAISTTNTSYDFSSTVSENLGGAYHFTVSAKSGSSLYKDGDATKSSARNYRGTLAAPSIKLTVDKVSGTIGYKITDSNPDDTVGTYILKVYDKDGKLVKDDITSSKLEGTIKGLTFGQKYSVTVTASSASLTNTETGNLSSGESGKENVTADGIVGISVTKKPMLSYTEGDTVDLSSMEVTVDFAVASDVKVTRKNFSKYGITVTPKHGTDVILSLNGKKMTVTCGSITASEEMVLEVKSGKCSHPTTTPEHEDANCGKEGHDRLICSVCGETVSDTVIPATGEHTFSEWKWLSMPTVSVDGVRERTCRVCGEAEHDQITYAEYIAMTSETTTEPSDTTPGETTGGGETTEPPVTTEKRKGNAFGGVSDLGKIFLFALIGVFLVVVVFIVGAVYMESRRNRRRRSNSRTNQARSNRSSYNRNERK